MTTETRLISTAALASLTTGTLLCKFSEMHEAAEFLMGHPIWTHHFADKSLFRKMREIARSQVPKLPTRLSGVTKDNFRQKLAALERRIGKAHRIRRGDGSTAMHPLAGIPKDKEVIVIGGEG